jgi:tRNA dimethylallyltransferase
LIFKTVALIIKKLKKNNFYIKKFNFQNSSFNNKKMWNFKKAIYNWLNDNKFGIIVITGPTASGKTSLSIEIANYLKNGEVINADSRQVYKNIPITSAIPTKKEQKNIPHHLFEYINSDKSLNVSEWRDDAIKKIYEIQSRGNIPIVCGGTGLWIDALTKNFTLGVKPDFKFRNLLSKYSALELYNKLLEKDEKEAKVLGKKNKKYLIRALEICKYKKSKTLSSKESQSLFPFFFIGITWERKVLYERIKLRNQEMFKNGFLEESLNFIKNLKKIPKIDNAFIAHGIPEALEYFNNQKTLKGLKVSMQKKTRNYAKRQLTWWRNDKRINFIDGKTYNKISLNDTIY